MRYVLGLDIGIASVGYALLALDSFDEPYKIVFLNSRIFPQAECPKDGASLALPRRLARGKRRRLRRRRHRLLRIRRLICRENLMNKEQLTVLYDKSFKTDIFSLRYQGLERKLLPEEWARVLIHIAKHRGFKSNRKSLNVSGVEDGKVLQAVHANRKILDKYRTVGEMFARDEKFSARKRNTKNSYILCVSRSMLQDEIITLFKAQKKFGNIYTSDTFRNEYIKIFASQRAFDDGPGSNSPYAGDQIEKMIGLCTFEKKNGEKRAPKSSYSFIKFNLLQKVNHLMVKSVNESRVLTKDERDIIVALAWKSPNVTYQSIRRAIGLPYCFTFTDIYYKYETGLDDEALIDKNEKARKFNYTKAYHDMRKALDKVYKNRIQELSEDELNTIAYIFTVNKTDVRIRQRLETANITAEDIDALIANLSTFSKFGHLSIKACKKINPYLEQGMSYDKACSSAGYDFKAHMQTKNKYLTSCCEEIQEISNPVVKRSLTQTIKIINAIVRKYGSPVEVHVELAREMSRSFKDRDSMRKNMENNRTINEKTKEILQNEFGLHNPTGMDIIKFKLYQEQQGVCIYSQTVMDLDRVLHDSKYAEVDHILPYSRSFDDSFNNKVLVKTIENQVKGNRTPMEYMASNLEKRHRFIIGVKANLHNPRKVSNLLRENFDARAIKEWKERNLTDTKYISKFVYNFLNDHLKLADGKRKRRIVPVNGAITAYIRKRLGINKIREDGDKHHAVDAVVIASITQGIINKVSKYSQWIELFYRRNPKGNLLNYETGEIITKDNFEEFIDAKFPEPWPLFRKELEARSGLNPKYELECLGLTTYTEDELAEIKPMFVSRMSNHKVKGSAHKETIRSPKLIDKGCSIAKIDLQDLKLSKDANGIEVIKNYYKPESDRLLYESLLHRLQAYKGIGKEAFKDEFHKPRKNGGIGPVVKKIKIITPSNLNVYTNRGRGIADNGDMLRVDVFYIQEGKEKGYYLVPIYVADTKKAVLPCKAIIAHKAYSEWKNMDNNNFVFSLYSNDLIYIMSAK